MSLINTLPYMFSPYPTNPYMSLWILNQPMAFQEAISYGLASAALLVALFPLLLLGRDNSDPLLLRVTILCVFALVRTIGQCVMASTLSIQSLSAVPEGVQGAVAAQLVLTIAFGDGRGLCTFLLFGAMAEHYELLRRCRARFDVICRGSASARSTAPRQTADIEGVHESERGLNSAGLVHELSTARVLGMVHYLFFMMQSERVERESDDAFTGLRVRCTSLERRGRAEAGQERTCDLASVQLYGRCKSLFTVTTID